MAMLEGTLSKWTNVMKGWQYRWFVLDENAGLLSYYTSKEKMMKGVRRGCVRMKGAVIGIDDQEDNTFTITVDHKTFHFQARDSEERERWVRRLEDTIRRHAYRGCLWGENQNIYLNVNNQLSSKRLTHLELLEKRVSEADAYLQLMIEQIEKIEIKISEISDPDEREKCNAVKENAHAMLDHIKHSIVTLQIAKNMAHPINGIYQGPGITAIGSPRDKVIDDDDDNDDDEFLSPADIGPVRSEIEFGLECLESRKGIVPILAPPIRSYSSSEGEDNYFDAYDKSGSSRENSPKLGKLRTTRPFIVEASQTSSTSEPSQNRPTCSTATKSQTPIPSVSRKSEVKFRIDGEQIGTDCKDYQTTISNSDAFDYDALYEDEDNTDLSMESHGSVVSHLLSQVKIGMDLTKVVLPTFILERRSLLEMYADYFAHPDLFLKIADLEEPRDRIVQVCRWYLSAYHAGRKSSVAKKPYNPIIGEVFQCYWDIADENQDDELSVDGPIPWCRKDQLTFVAEQVSHHPPISAFYAEHSNKKISFLAHVWTKSKFLGLSIGVHNIGEGIVTLCDLKEEYILTFPNGYGRSILTVPWIELGGSVTITCPQTGYNANVEFLTKPFYGGKRNKVTAEIYSPNEKKPFVSIAGEWSGLMEAKWHDSGANKNELFIDVNQIPIHKKKVRPIAQQTDLESRKIWMEVTAGLKLNDIDRATKAKSLIEQKQREEAKIRKQNNEVWNNRYFQAAGDGWIYLNPLNERLNCNENKR